MLGRNSKKIEGMLHGLDKCSAAAAEGESKTYDLAAATKFPPLDKAIKVQMTVPDLHPILAFDTQKILTARRRVLSRRTDGRWADNLPKLMQAKLIESLENADLLGKVSRPFDSSRRPIGWSSPSELPDSLTPQPKAEV